MSTATHFDEQSRVIAAIAGALAALGQGGSSEQPDAGGARYVTTDQPEDRPIAGTGVWAVASRQMEMARRRRIHDRRRGRN
jgi:hypothetical protein